MLADRLGQPRILLGLAALALAIAIVVGMPLDQDRAADRDRMPQAMGSAGAVFAQALGGIRSAAAAYLWIKLDEAHHEFYGGDFRSERSHMPLFRVATWLDPRMERAYYVGAYMLYLYGEREEAIAFAHEGMRNNPDSALLVMNVGQLYLFQQGDKARREALQYLSLAERMSRKSNFELRFYVLSSLDAAYKKWKIPNEPKAVVEELRQLRARQREQGEDHTELPGHEHEDEHDADQDGVLP